MRVRLTVGQLAQPGVDVAAQLDDLEILARGAQLSGAAQAARPHAGARGQRSQRRGAADRVAGIGPGRDGHELKALGQLGGHVLARVHGEVDLAGEQRALELGDPARLVAAAAAAVAGGRDRDQLGVLAEPLGHPARLRERQRAPACADAHQRRCARASALGRACTAGQRLVLGRGEPEQVAHERHALVHAVVAQLLHARGRRVQQAVDDRAGEGVDALEVARRSRLPLALVLAQHLLGDLGGMGAQRGQRRADLQRAQPDGEVADLLLDDALGLRASAWRTLRLRATTAWRSSMS